MFRNILFLMYTCSCSYLSFGNVDGKNLKYLRTQLKELEDRAELYYENQKEERIKKNHMQSSYPHINANFPCLMGIEPIGTNDSFSVLDDHKFSCGLSKIKKEPIVYSFGSCKTQNFETGVLELRPDSKIFVFEINSANMVPIESRFKSVKYFNVGLGYSAQGNLQTLHQIMTSLNHTYIDVLKMDIEGCEWNFIQSESHLLKYIGQVLIEVHVDKSKNNSPLPMLEIFEKSGLRLFFKEGNFRYGSKCCTEWSLIQRHWQAWEENKLNLKLPM